MTGPSRRAGSSPPTATTTVTGENVGLEALLAASPGLERDLRGIARAAVSDAPVLILGEPGSGRSTLARAIHAASDRAGGPLVELDAGATPTALFEAELFGYRAGAFTGAERSFPGRVAGARGGSLLLDHVEEIPLAFQPKLLRLLAEGRFTPLGGEETKADVRFLAIAADDLPLRVERGAFREDLFFRLEVLTFRLPALRRRKRDLPLLADAMLADLGERFGRRELRLSTAAREWMADYPWPGNLRELRNVLERAVILGRGGEIDPRPPAGAAGAAPRSLAAVEKEQILRALAYTRGHQGRAAELLGISRKTLWQKRRRYGIP